METLPQVHPVPRLHPSEPARRAWHEGLPFVLGSLGAALLLARPAPRLSTAIAAAGLACAAFFRDPDRATPLDPDAVFAAADGRILSVDRVDEPWWIGGPADRVVVFLAVTDVHVNRCPVEGHLVDVCRIPGRHAPAFLYAEHNCRDMLAIRGARGRLTVAQISGVLARRSVQWCTPGERLAAGQRLGMIRFGSRTDVYLPAGATRILVEPGDRVVGGVTPLARYVG